MKTMNANCIKFRVGGGLLSTFNLTFLSCGSAEDIVRLFMGYVRTDLRAVHVPAAVEISEGRLSVTCTVVPDGRGRPVAPRPSDSPMIAVGELLPFDVGYELEVRDSDGRPVPRAELAAAVYEARKEELA